MAQIAPQKCGGAVWVGGNVELAAVLAAVENLAPGKGIRMPVEWSGSVGIAFRASVAEVMAERCAASLHRFLIAASLACRLCCFAALPRRLH
nr:hypothetical protein HUO10_005490 [Paraburkholderia busanensis]